jgi:integrase
MDARTVRWEHVDFGRGTIHRPRPKGGADRAFTVPLSAAALELLRRRRDQNAILFPRDEGWAFPSRDMQGKVTFVQQARERASVDGRKVGQLPSPHRLRDTFATAAKESGVDYMSIKVLMNHTLPSNGDVTEGYIRPSVEHLRAQVEKVAAFLLARMRAE